MLESGGLNSSGNEDDLTSTSEGEDGGQGQGQGLQGVVAVGVVDDEAFETLTAEIKEVLAELAQDKSMDAFRGEYEKLYAALERSHKNESRLSTRCTELLSEIANGQAAVDAAHDKQREDADTIASLKKEIEKAWKMVDMTAEREERARETIETLNTEIQNLTKVIEEKTLGAEDTNLNELRKLRDELTANRDNLRVEVSELKAAEGKREEEIKILKEEKSKLEGRITSLTGELQSRTNEMNREVRRKERTEREVKQLKSEVEERTADISTLESEALTVGEAVGRLETALREQRELNSGLQQQLEAAGAKALELEGQVEAHLSTAQQLEGELARRREELAEKEAAVGRAKAETQRATKEAEEQRKKWQQAERRASELENDKGRLKAESSALKKEVGELKLRSAADRKKVEDTKNEVAAAEQALKRAVAASARAHRDAAQAAESAQEERRKSAHAQSAAEKHVRALAGLEEERDHYLAEAQALARRVDELMEEMRDAEAAVFSYRKEVSDRSSRARQQANLYQAARNDRASLSRALTEAKDEAQDLRGKLRVLQHQFDQLKEEMVAKESALAKEGQEQQKLVREKEDLIGELDKAKEENRTAREKCKEIEKELGLVTDRHRATQVQLDKVNAQLEHSHRERSSINLRLSKKEEECQAERRKQAVQDRVLQRGEAKYQERIEDIRVLKLEVKRLRAECDLLAKDSKKSAEAGKEILRLQRDLLKEKARAKALETETENPLNIHRWRKLEGSDPSTFELIQKIQALQRRMVACKKMLENRELELKEKDRLVSELQAVAARQAAVRNEDEDAAKDKELSRLRREEDRRVCLSAENNMLRTETKEAQNKAEALAKELHQSKRKYLDLSKSHQKLRDKYSKMEEEVEYDDPYSANGRRGRRRSLELETSQMEQPPLLILRRRPASAYARTSMRKQFAGGGFNMTA